MRLRYDRLVKEIWRSLKTQPINTVFTPDMVAGLDEPVQKYFLHSIAPGTPLASYVELEMSGGFRFQPEAEWLPMQAKEIISASAGFVWQADIGKGAFKFSGADYHNRGEGRTKFSLWGLIPLVDAQNDNIDRSSGGRFAVEYVWLPSALLPQNDVAWQAIDKNTIQANFQLDDEPITLTLNINDDGKLLSVSLLRWSNSTEDKSWQYIPFGGKVEAEATFDGYTVPTQLNVGYWFGTDKYWAFFQATVSRAEFN